MPSNGNSEGGGRRPYYKKNKQEVTDNFGHLQPQAVELEQAVLGALMIEKDAYYQVSEILRPESFYDNRHKIIYEAIRRLNLEEKPVDILTVTEQLRSTNQLEEVGGPFYITQLSGMVASSAHIEYHARIIAQKATARALISYTSGIQTKAFDATTDIDELMQEAEGKLFELSQTNMKKDYTQIDPVIKEAYEMLQKAAARTDGMSGIPSGFHALDKMTSGWQNSDLVILAARPAMGKTAFALSMAKNIAVDQKIPVAVFSLEMANVQLVNRLIVNVCEIKGETLKSGQLKPFEWNQLDFRIKQLTGAPLYLDDTPSLSVFELRTKARRLVREHGVKIIMIDYLQLMNASGMGFGSRQEEVSTISRSLKGLAKELNIPILALSQLNRGVENREGGDKRPQLSDLRESGAIEQDADMVLFIHRPEYYKIYQDPETGRDLRGKAEIIVAKHRNGAVGNVLLSFRGEYARFQNPEEDDVSSIMSQSGGDGAESSSVDSISAVNDNSAFPPPPDNNFPPLPDPFQLGPTQSPF
ncbi:MAG: replicative DNA helicase [Prevotella sp.]|nr:replicative DNA helicase [Prevotella sp.]MDY5666144.1 replicative DNA helicase [Alloprevotella sp.]